MLEEIGSPENAEPILRAKLEAGERLMGFGHAIYRVRDPRANVFSRTAEAFFEADDDLYTLAMHVEKTALDLLNEYKPGRRLQTNVEFYTALLLRGLGLHPDIFTPMFAIARVAGWTAHCLEQRALDRIIRPESVYTGSKDGHWTPLEERAVTTQ
jgi:citrate synthase